MKLIRTDNYIKVANSYLNVGHSDPSVGDWNNCNRIWAILQNKEFKVANEGILNDTHMSTGISALNPVYKGRVDICKKQASLAPCGMCYPDMGYGLCEKLRFEAIFQIHKNFGNDIRIHEFK